MCLIVGTYNMQGTSIGFRGGRKKMEGIGMLYAQGAQVICLQECNDGPKGYYRLGNDGNPFWEVTLRRDNYTVYWNYYSTTSSEDDDNEFIIYWLQFGDKDYLRCSTAILVHRSHQVTNVHVIEAPTIPGDDMPRYTRALLGVRVVIGGEPVWVWCLHAIATGGLVSEYLVIEFVRAIKLVCGNERWVLVGDFNCRPGALLTEVQRSTLDDSYQIDTLCTDSSTHNSGRWLDYCLFDRRRMGRNQSPRLLEQYRGISDHMPALFFLRCR